MEDFNVKCGGPGCNTLINPGKFKRRYCSALCQGRRAAAQRVRGGRKPLCVGEAATAYVERHVSDIDFREEREDDYFRDWRAKRRSEAEEDVLRIVASEGRIHLGALPHASAAEEDC